MRRLLGILGKYGTLLFLGAMIVIFSIAKPDVFPTGSNFLLILNSISLVSIIAGGLTLVLVVGEFDLSIGSLSSLSGILCVYMLSQMALPIPLAIALTIAFGILIGLFNGTLVTKAGVNALIATLGTGSVLIGLNYLVSSGRPLAISDSAFTSLALGKVFGVPNLVIVMFVVLTILWIVLNRTELGIQMQAVGGNPEAARMSGILNDRVKLIAFGICGSTAALTGTLLSARLGSGQVTAGDSYLLDSMAAAFLGSAVLRDGQFHIVGTFIGALTVGVGLSGIYLFGWPTYMQLVFRGGLLVCAVALATIARRYSKA